MTSRRAGGSSVAIRSSTRAAMSIGAADSELGGATLRHNASSAGRTREAGRMVSRLHERLLASVQSDQLAIPGMVLQITEPPARFAASPCIRLWIRCRVLVQRPDGSLLIAEQNPDVR